MGVDTRIKKRMISSMRVWALACAFVGVLSVGGVTETGASY
jgi:hypothetical protein